MLSKICWWILALVAFICLTPLLAIAVSGHTDFGVRLGTNIKKRMVITPVMTS
jgi:hypothetical protein